MAWCVSREKADPTYGNAVVVLPPDRPSASAYGRPIGDEPTYSNTSSMPDPSTSAALHSSAMAQAIQAQASQHKSVPDVVNFMTEMRDQLNQISERQDQQFELLKSGQSRLHEVLSSWQYRRPSITPAPITAPSAIVNGFPTSEPETSEAHGLLATAQESRPTGQMHAYGDNRTSDGKVQLRDPEVLEDTLHDLIHELRESYAQLQDMKKQVGKSQHNKPFETAEEVEKSKQQVASEMEKMRDSLDRTLIQVSSWVPPEKRSGPSSALKEGSKVGKSGIGKASMLSSFGGVFGQKEAGSDNDEFLKKTSYGHKASEDELAKIEEHLEFLMSGEVKEDHDRLEKIVHSQLFELFFGGCIVLNTIVMGLEMQYMGERAGVTIKWEGADDAADWMGDALKIADKVFLWVFTAELVAKMVCLRRKFWRDRWNWLDGMIVGFGLVEEFVNLDVGVDPMMLRLVRLVKLIRFVKMFKMAGHLFVLNLIMKSVATTISTLAWSMLLLAMLQAVCGMFVGQMVYGFITDPDGDPEIQRAVYKYYGTFTKTMFTMFEITHVNYSRAARILTDNISENWAWFFVFYRCFVGFAVLQVIRAVFIQQTLRVADNDRELLLMTNQRNKQNMLKKLTDVYRLIDIEGMGEVGEETFTSVLRIPKMQAWMGALDIDPKDPENLFKLLDLNGDGVVSLEEFILASSKLRGSAQSIDLFHVHDLCTRTEEKVDLLIPEKDRGHHHLAGHEASVIAGDDAILKGPSDGKVLIANERISVTAANV